jgi:hypothetical protein
MIDLVDEPLLPETAGYSTAPLEFYLNSSLRYVGTILTLAGVNSGRVIPYEQTERATRATIQP